MKRKKNESLRNTNEKIKQHQKAIALLANAAAEKIAKKLAQ